MLSYRNVAGVMAEQVLLSHSSGWLIRPAPESRDLETWRWTDLVFELIRLIPGGFLDFEYFLTFFDIFFCKLGVFSCFLYVAGVVECIDTLEAPLPQKHRRTGEGRALVLCFHIICMLILLNLSKCFIVFFYLATMLLHWLVAMQ